MLNRQIDRPTNQNIWLVSTPEVHLPLILRMCGGNNELQPKHRNLTTAISPNYSAIKAKFEGQIGTVNYILWVVYAITQINWSNPTWLVAAILKILTGSKMVQFRWNLLGRYRIACGCTVRSSSPQPRQVGLVVYLTQNLSLRGRSPPIIFARIVRPINALQHCRRQFSPKINFLAEFLQSKCDFKPYTAVLRFGAPFGAVRDNVWCSSWAHWKARSGLPISVNWTFLARCYGLSATSENRSKIGDFAPTRSLWLKISGRNGRPPTIKNFCIDS